MPVRNEFFGIYKTVKVGKGADATFIIVKDANRNRNMAVQNEELVQGTPKSRVLNIGAISEEITINAPLLIGGGANIDGRVLLTKSIVNALKPKNASLPLLRNATVSISNTSPATCSFTLVSDGGPDGSDAFMIYDDVPAGFVDDSGHNHGIDVPSYRLDPTITAGGQTPTRVATFYDFRVALAGYFMNVISATIQVDVGVESTYFLGGAGNDPLRGGPDPYTQTEIDLYNWGTQRPWMGVKSIAISGSGQAAISLKDLSTPGDYDFLDGDYGTNYSPPEESINMEMREIVKELTLQTPGCVNYSPTPFTIEMWDCAAATWRSLFATIAAPTVPVVDLSRSVLNNATVKVNAGMLTVDFKFTCWVK